MKSDIGPRRLAELLGAETTVDGHGPAYRRLTERVRVLVGDGRLPTGTRLPAERDLAGALGLSRSTVTRAYGELRSTGWADARQGAGTWVTMPAGSPPHPGGWAPFPGGPTQDGVIDLVHAAAEAPPALAGAVERVTGRIAGALRGHGYEPGGLIALRRSVAERFTRRGVPTDPDQIVITQGALHGVTASLAVLVGPGDRVVVEHPTYPSALDAVADLGARVVPVAVDAAEPARWARDVVRATVQTSARVAYVMPDFHNPTAGRLDDADREVLVRGLARAGAVAIVDESFVDLRLDDDAPDYAPAGSFAPDTVVTVGSMSKLVWGGLRIGWVRAGPELAAAIRARVTRSQLAAPLIEQMVAVEIDEVHDEVVAYRRGTLAARRDLVRATLAEALPEWHVPRPAGGVMLWCRLDGPISTELTARADALGLRLVPGSRFGTGHAFDDHLRVPFTLPEPTLIEAMDRLTQAARTLGSPGRVRAVEEAVV